MRHGWRLLALWILILAAYSNSFQAGLVYDNASLIGQDPRIQTATRDNVGRIFTESYWPDRLATGLYRPLTSLTYLVNYAVLGDGPAVEGYHWVNLALHLVNAGLVYALGLLVFEAALPAWALAGIWGLHPLLTESVTNIVGRADLLAALGVLSGLLCYARGMGTTGRRRLACLGGLVVAQAVGLFSKESAAVLPGLMLLLDVLGRKRSEWRRRLPFYAVLLLPFAAFFYLRGQLHASMVVGPGENPLVGAGFWTARWTAVKVIGRWPWLFLWPARLSADYSYNAVPLADWKAPEALAAFAFCLAGAAAIVRWWRKQRPFAFFLAFFFVTLTPTANLVILIGSIMAERFAYLPAIGLAGCVVAGIQVIGDRRRAAWVVAGVAVLALGARTYARNFDWHDELSLWSSAAAVCPESFKAHANFANALAEAPSRLPEAVAEYQAALRIKPDFAEGHLNLGNALVQLGRMTEAIAEYQAALRLKPDSPETHYNLGMALERSDRLPEALVEFQAALRLRPDFAEAHGGMGNVLASIPGRLPQAIAEYQAALRLNPDLTEAHFNLGVALLQTPGKLPEAIQEFQAVLRAQPNYWEAHYNLGQALLETGRLPDAIAEYEAAIRIRPDPRIEKFVEQLRARAR